MTYLRFHKLINMVKIEGTGSENTRYKHLIYDKIQCTTDKNIMYSNDPIPCASVE